MTDIVIEDEELQDDEEEYYRDPYEDDELTQSLDRNFHRTLNIPFQANAEDLEQHAIGLLEEFYNASWEYNEDALPEDESWDFSSDKYIHYLEYCFIRLIQDVGTIAKMVVPHTLSQVPEIKPHITAGTTSMTNANLTKLALNAIYSTESMGYPYPKTPLGATTASYSSDCAFRTTTEHEMSVVIEGLDSFPAHWRQSLAEFMNRSVEFLYHRDKTTS